jgi:flavodoxin
MYKEERNMTLTAYFTYSGNAKKLAEKVAGVAGGDLFEIKPEQAYSQDYQECVDEARKEKEQNARPAVEGVPKDISKYDTVVLCFPNWCRTCPMPVLTFVEGCDLTGKTVYIAVTNGGGGVGDSTSDITASAKGAKVIDAVDGNNLSDEQIKSWLGL